MSYLELRRTIANLMWAHEIELDVFTSACEVILNLECQDLPLPTLIVHGPKSVVLLWTYEGTNIYVTITAGQTATMLSTRERIIQRFHLRNLS